LTDDVRRRRLGGRLIDEGADTPRGTGPIGLEGVCGLRDGAVCGSNGPTGSPNQVIGLRGMRELVEVDGRVGGDVGARPGIARGSGRGGVESGNGGDVDHVLVVSAHQLDVGLSPRSIGIRGPADDTRCADVRGGWSER